MEYIQENFHKFIPVLGSYHSNGRTSLEYHIENEEEGYTEPACTASVNLPDEEIEPGYVAVKDYSENEGLYELMVQKGHIEPAIRYIRQGFVTIPVCKLLL